LRPNFIWRASGSVVLIWPPGRSGALVWLRRTAEAAPVAHHFTRAIGLIGTVCLVLGAPVVDQPAVADLKPSLPVLGNRLRLGRSLRVEAPPCLPQPGPPSPAACQLPGAAHRPAPPRSAHPRRRRCAPPRPAPRRRSPRNCGSPNWRRRLGTSSRRPRSPRAAPAPPRHRGRAPGRTAPPGPPGGEPENARLSRGREPVRADYPEGDVLAAAALDPPRRALAHAVGVGQQREHHPRVVGRAAVAVGAVGGIERPKVELLDRLDHEPG
jgi:hypothetical protein